VGERTDKFLARRAADRTTCVWANLIAVAVCLFDYTVAGHEWALETLAALVILINGGYLLMERAELKRAQEDDAMTERENARARAVRDQRWGSGR